MDKDIFGFIMDDRICDGYIIFMFIFIKIFGWIKVIDYWGIIINVVIKICFINGNNIKINWIVL